MVVPLTVKSDHLGRLNSSLLEVGILLLWTDTRTALLSDETILQTDGQFIANNFIQH